MIDSNRPPRAWLFAGFSFLLATGAAACGDSDGGATGGSGGAGTSSAVTAGDPVSGPTTTTGVASTSTAAGTGGAAETSTASAGGGGAGGDAGPWSCLGDVEWPALQKETLRVQMVLEDQLVGTTLGGLPVRFCLRDDLACADPVAETVADENGKVDADVPVTPDVGFDGYFEVGPGLANGDVDVPVNVVMTVRPWTNDYGAGGDTPQGIVTSNVLGLLLDAFGIAPLDGHGHAAIIAHDCFDADAAGVVPDALSGGADAQVVYLENGNTPAPDATSTDDSGVAAIANLTAGRVDLRVTLEATGETIGEIDAIIRDGGVTSLGFNPTPLP